ncbi:MAG: hypothetical protein KKG92_14180 [Gammaproteobacteria bacterium]|nr:hypothetical protein [Gammaproteobacteria bacterium]
MFGKGNELFGGVVASAGLAWVVWTVPRPVDGCAHFFKYRLAFVVDDVCVIRYDNERGKGDHRHIGNREMAYLFSSPRQLIADFFEDIARWLDENRND